MAFLKCGLGSNDTRKSSFKMVMKEFLRKSILKNKLGYRSSVVNDGFLICTLYCFNGIQWFVKFSADLLPTSFIHSLIRIFLSVSYFF